MFNQNNEEKKLDWMYKGPNSLVNREDYLLGKPVDKSLEQINEEEKNKKLGITVSKNKVEHECIPPSIRDFNSVVKSEQVDLSTKLQEDPLVTIKKREEQYRRQFLQNPVQLKKLQKALDAQAKKNKKNKKKRKKSYNEKDLDSLLIAKLKEKSSKLKEDDDLDTILMHKFNALKDKLSKDDLNQIMEQGSDSDSDSSDSDLNNKLMEKIKSMKRKHKNKSKRRYSSSSSSSSSSNSDSDSESKYKKHKSKYSKKDQKHNYSSNYKNRNSNSTKSSNNYNQNSYKKNKNMELTEEEKERKRRQMMENAVVRDKERSTHLKLHREINKIRESKDAKFDKEFAHREYMKNINHSSVESRIKSNINKIQRSKDVMNTNFSKR